MEKILISAGVVLSLGGVWLMIRSDKKRIDGKLATQVGGLAHPRMFICGWFALILGALAQIYNALFLHRVETFLKAEELNLQAIEKVMGNLNLLATIGIGAIGLLVVLALFVVGYNVFVSTRTLENLRKEFREEIKSAREELVDYIDVLNAMLNAEIERTRAGQFMLQGSIDLAAETWSKAISIYTSTRLKAKGEVKDNIDALISRMLQQVEFVLEECKKKKVKPDINKIRKYISEIPLHLSIGKEKIEKMLNELT